MMTDFWSVCIGLETTQTLAFSDKVEFFWFSSLGKFALARGGTSSYKVGLSLSLGLQQVVQWVLDLVYLVPKEDKIYTHPDTT